MNRSITHWCGDSDEIPQEMVILLALPGVGNVGKVLADAIIEEHQSDLIAWIMHPDLPPHATLVEGLLRPPRIEIHLVQLPVGLPLLIVTGDAQPLTPAGQFELSTRLLEMFAEAKSEIMFILAGLAAEVEDDSVHLVCSDEDTRDAFAERGIEASTEAPEAGMIGMAGLLASMAPMHSLASACIVAETLGSTVDVITGQRIANWIEQRLGIPLAISVDTTEKTAERIRKEIAMDTSELDSLLETSEPSPEFYV
ncbi:MAG TPA: hypothetical protein HA330_03495 [Candidatus Thalassarchaeaceae archaeon]|nr:MAG TPA: hypothetical protein D7H85_03495 [Candidatus Poseidoniales archaeon]HII48932.1 hypothetical protein [Candidatus Thalassarchaeaceae archaeon]|tara:strand:+ start:1144 stop:1905 length:762 start_codon:yes stop_codon:yes gene_type:complete